MVKLIRKEEQSFIKEDTTVLSPTKEVSVNSDSDRNLNKTDKMTFVELVQYYNKDAVIRINNKGDVEVGWP